MSRFFRLRLSSDVPVGERRSTFEHAKSGEITFGSEAEDWLRKKTAPRGRRFSSNR
jgi:hypothetical protein